LFKVLEAEKSNSMVLAPSEDIKLSHPMVEGRRAKADESKRQREPNLLL
jgi:hypothetical protein